MTDRPTLTADDRRAPRRKVSWRARLLLGRTEVVECRVIDASAGGLGLIAPRPMAPGQPVQVAVQVPDGKGHDVVVRDGKVAVSVLTAQGHRIGLQLATPIDMPESARPVVVAATA